MQARKHKSEPKKRPFMQYKRFYNPQTDGYGTPDEWREAFNVRMGFDEASVIMGKSNPLAVLGLTVPTTWTAIKTAFRKLALSNHPDRAGLNNMTVDEATARMQKIVAAYVVLERRYGH